MSRDIPSKVHQLSRVRTYAGWLKVDQVEVSYEKFDGEMSDPVVREIVDRGNAVALLPYDPSTGKVLMIRQFLPGAHAADVDAWPLQTIAGMIDPGETPAEAALREAREEAGLEVSEEGIRPGPVYLVSPGAFSEIIHVFLVEADLSDAGGVHGLDEEGENIRVELIGLDDALAEIAGGKVLPSLAVVALLQLKLNLLAKA